MSGIHTLLAGHTLVGRYCIGEVIGRGGFAVVYEAHDERLDRTVAVKVVTMAAADDAGAEELRARFQREARSSAGLQHPNVVAIFDFGTDPTLGIDFLVMERLLGEDLRERLQRPAPVSLAEGMHILRSAAEGIAVGHAAGIIHRDVKPGNIFLVQHGDAERGRVCVLDFGIALIAAAADATRLTQNGVPLSIAYASPEQLTGTGEITPASDVFSLGVVAYELLGRRRPFSGDAMRAAEERTAALPPLRVLDPEIPPHLSAAVQRAMNVDPAERFANAGAFASALDADYVEYDAAPVVGGATATLPSPALAARPAEPGRRPVRWAPIAAAAALVVATAAGALLLTRDHERDNPAPADARPTDARSPVEAPNPNAATTVPQTVDSAAAAPAVPQPEERATGQTAQAPPPAAEREPAAPSTSAPAPTPPRVPPAREAQPSPAAAEPEFRERLSHSCQSLPDGGAAVACLNRDLAAADRELNEVYQRSIDRLEPDDRTALRQNQRAWLRRYDAAITSYYSTSWGQHSRVRVLPSQIRALRDRAAYLRRR